MQDDHQRSRHPQVHLIEHERLERDERPVGEVGTELLGVAPGEAPREQMARQLEAARRYNESLERNIQGQQRAIDRVTVDIENVAGLQRASEWRPFTVPRCAASR